MALLKIPKNCPVFGMRPFRRSKSQNLSGLVFDPTRVMDSAFQRHMKSRNLLKNIRNQQRK
jgi:hypothetical protein